MNILLINDYFPPKNMGGGEISVYNLAMVFSKLGHNVKVLTRYPKSDGKVKLDEIGEIYNVEYSELSNPALNLIEFNYISPRKLAKKIGEILKKNQIDVIHANNGISAIAVMEAKRTGIKLPSSILTFRSYIHICPLGNALCIEENKRVRCSFRRTMHCVSKTMGNTAIKIAGLVPFSILNRLTYRLNNKAINFFDGYTADSDFVREVMLRNSEIQPQEIRTIYEAVDIERFDRSKNFDNKKIILFVGRLTREKGIMTLVRAFADVLRKHEDSKLVIIGEGGLRKEVETFVKRRCMEDNVKLLGYVPYKKISLYYKKSDLVVFPSIWPEPFGLVSVEAMLSGKPVVASKVGGIPEVIKDGKTGILVKPNEPKELAEAIIKILDNLSLGIEMGKKGYKIARSKFDREVIAKQTLEIYKNVIEGDL